MGILRIQLKGPLVVLDGRSLVASRLVSFRQTVVGIGASRVEADIQLEYLDSLFRVPLFRQKLSPSVHVVFRQSKSRILCFRFDNYFKGMFKAALHEFRTERLDHRWQAES